MLAELPPFAAWRFVEAVDGFEVMYCADGLLRGHTSAVEDGAPYAVRYRITVDERWHTREVEVWADTTEGSLSTTLLSDGRGRWSVDGIHAPHLDGVVDVDLEASACTNTLPVHRMPLPVGVEVPTAVVYVQAADLGVRRLDQTYRRLDERGIHYSSDGGFQASLTFDAAGLVVDYPGLASRVA